ncbi:pentatricopeptide repeat-containing protein At3g24000, mitochondrial [Gastrolobium bilobum]|uniref:pentatricopeptide repeat-containing protein At3g24000, mitochondrial n=1 Tax=Gastrolobium bilobum TaxID=150636 RepID=UPI002AAF6379|nr:pentatricopeptide repeat-containing protein At3g24000, mitochondrial [Gastrolobium bilobum]
MIQCKTALKRHWGCCRTLWQSATQSTFDVSEDAKLDNSCIIEDRNILSPSLKSQNSLHVLDLIDNGSLEPDRTLYNTLLKRCTQLGKLKEGRLVHSHILNSKLTDDLVIQNSVLFMYAKCGSLEDARMVFDEMPIKDMVTWTSLITGYAQNERAKDALVLFPQMLRDGSKPNEFTLSSLVKSCGFIPSYNDGKQIHACSWKYGCNSNVFVGSSLVDMYARCGYLGEARLVFDELVSKNEVSWNALITGYARKGEGEEALALFVNMQREDYRPTDFTYSALLCSSSCMGSLEQGKWLHAHMIKSGRKLVGYVGNTLLHMYAKSGSIHDAEKVFDRLVKLDVVSCNSMLIGYAQHGLGKKAVQQFEEMLRVGIEPNDITFINVLTACSHAGLLEEGKHYFGLMRKYNIEPKVSHYATMVDLLGRAGLLDQAKRFIEEMPVEPTVAIWGALLGASRMHKNMKMGAYAAQRVFELDPFYSGTHILLANIYASAGRWRDAAKVRKIMKDNGLKKEPACSWVEIENYVHVFVANDIAHPQKDKVHKMWEKLNQKIKEIGYVPDTSHVLLFVDQQEKEVNLQYHSEKLALAFALMNTSPGSTIRIMKNIRVCGDCHSAIKYVSLLVKREIIVRDTNRFHHFRDGFCSCGDYW